MKTTAESERRNQEIESNYRARNRDRINKIFSADIDMFPREIWELYYDTEAKDVDICIELDAIGHLHEHRLDELDKHKLTYCSHKTRLETLNKLLCDQLRGRDIIIDISEPWKSDILAKFIRGDTDWDKSKMGIEPANNNDASAEPED